MDFVDMKRESQKSSGVRNEGKLIGDSSHIVNSVSRFFNNDEMSDIILKVGKKNYYAHRFVLVLMSDVFSALCSQRWKDSSRTEIELNECDQCIPVFPVFLQYLYHGSVHVDISTALPLLMLADKYNVQPLKISCEEYIQSQVEDGNVCGALRWLPYLQLCGHEKLEKACQDVIVLDMDFVLKCDDFYQLSLDFLVNLYSRDDLVVTSENSLYMGMVQWTNAQSNKPTVSSSAGGNVITPTTDDCVTTLVPLIRFAMMSAQQLMEIEKSDFFIRHQTMMTSYINAAHHFRSIACEMQVLDDSFINRSYRPRNYTDSRWCLSFNVASDGNNFHPKQINSGVANDVLSFNCYCPKMNENETNWEFQILVGEKYDYQFEVYEQWRFAGGINSLNRIYPRNNTAANQLRTLRPADNTAAADEAPPAGSQAGGNNQETAARNSPTNQQQQQQTTTTTQAASTSASSTSVQSSDQAASVPLYISVRPVKPLRCNTAVDVSLFLVRKNKICRLLDTKTVYGSVPVMTDLPFFDNVPIPMSRDRRKSKVSASSATASNHASNRLTGKAPRVFQPAPMHFSFIQPSPNPPSNYNSENPVVLEYRLPKEWLMLPPEVPCVSFPIRFVPPRSLQGVVCVAIICKPRLRDPEIDVEEDEDEDQENF